MKKKNILFSSNEVSYINLPHILNVVLEDSFPSNNNTSVFCFPLNEKNEVLVFQHSKDVRRKIDILGGHVENNESMLSALNREVLEESGYSIKNIKYLGTKYFTLYGDKPEGYNYPFPKSNMLFFYAKIDKQITEELFEDSAEAMFMSIEDLIENTPEETSCLLKELLKIVK